LILFNSIQFTDQVLLSINKNVKIKPYTAKLVEGASLRKTAEIQAIIRILNPEVTTISNKAFTSDTLKALIAKMPKANIENKMRIGQ
jgi:hypothetical protein